MYSVWNLLFIIFCYRLYIIVQHRCVTHLYSLPLGNINYTDEKKTGNVMQINCR